MSTATRRSLLVVAAVSILVAGGCTTTEKAPEASSLGAVRMASSPEFTSIVEDYREARYQPAFDRSKALARSSASPLREQASWIAGLSAYQMQQLDEAELQFMASGRSQDPRLSIDSKIMIADIRVLQNRWSDAAQLYREAAAGLSGDERSRVLGYADVASSQASLRATGQGSSAPSARTGSSSSGAPVLGANPSSTKDPSRSAPPSGSGSFALQAGAFQNESNARRRAAEIATSARQAGLGEPRVVRTRDAGGREFWAVQVGQFTSRAGAEAAKARVASLNLIITAAS